MQKHRHSGAFTTGRATKLQASAANKKGSSLRAPCHSLRYIPSGKQLGASASSYLFLNQDNIVLPLIKN
jgi:hypothetical protein